MLEIPARDPEVLAKAGFRESRLPSFKAGGQMLNSDSLQVHSD